MRRMAREPANILSGIADRRGFRAWLQEHHASEPECWVACKRGRPVAGGGVLGYLDAVEEALCFGWIDSTVKPLDGVRMQRFSPRRPNSPWTELNRERVRRLEKLGLMTDAGRAALAPEPAGGFRVDADVEAALKAARCWTKFTAFPPLYQRVRAYNVAFYKKRDPNAYAKALDNLVARTKRGEMYGEWNDYGRLLDY